ncbi:Uncharacterised protein [Vibrio cholerae]|nr:Uncharacterised protein [Vibrio cholerae]
MITTPRKLSSVEEHAPQYLCRPFRRKYVIKVQYRRIGQLPSHRS